MTLKAHEDPAAHSTQSRGQGAVSPFATFPPDHAQDEASVCCCCSTFNSPWTFPTSPANCSLPTVRTSLVPPPAHIKTLLPQALCTCCSNWNALFFKKKKKKKDPCGSVLIPFKALLKFTSRPSHQHSQCSLHLQLGFHFLHLPVLSNCFILAPEQWLARGRNSQDRCQLNGQKREGGNGTTALGRDSFQ